MYNEKVDDQPAKEKNDLSLKVNIGRTLIVR